MLVFPIASDGGEIVREVNWVMEVMELMEVKRTL